MSSAESALAVRDRSAEMEQFMPALSVEQALERYSMINEIVSRVLKEGEDFGVIPGAGTKKVLLKPGAEKLTTFFGLSKHFDIAERVEDWSGDEHGGEPFFYYLYRCRLFRGDLLIAEGDGSCNSRESKYRYRKADRVCPSCGGAYIIKGQAQYGGGWLCFKKKGGCGAKFDDRDPEIEGQQAGRVVNPDICDQVNTIQKMAAKRALVAATLLAVNASDFFTQDVEDGGVIEARPESVSNATPPPARTPPPPRQQQQQARRPQPAPAANGRAAVAKVEAMRDKLLAAGVEEVVLNDMLGEYGCTEVQELTEGDANKYLAGLAGLLNKTLAAARGDEDEQDF